MKKYQFWFCTGSQDLYGDECLEHVAQHSKVIVEELNKSGNLPFEVIWKPTLITNEVIRKTLNEANADYLFWVCVHEKITRQLVRGSSLLSPCGCQGLNSGHQSWQQSLLPLSHLISPPPPPPLF